MSKVVLKRPVLSLIAASAALAALPALATSKIDQILQTKGFQIEANADPNGDFSSTTMLNANYDSVIWQWTSNLARQGTAPGIPWGRFVQDPSQMPPQGGEGPYMSQLYSLQLGDEPALENSSTFNSYVSWFNSARSNPAYNNTILFTDLQGISDGTIVNFVAQAHPDLLTFDNYPWQSTYVPANGGTPSHGGTPFGDPPTNWYGDLRRFRDDVIGTSTDFGIYRQTFHAVQDYNSIVYRDPSPGELALNTFGAMAFNAKFLADFEFNDGAGSLFNGGAMSSPTPLYNTMQKVNFQAHAFGKALVNLTPLNDTQNGGQPTTDILFVRGQYKDSNNVTQYNPVPVGFAPNNNDNNSFITQWTAYSTAQSQGNVDLAEDKWLTGFQSKNLTANNNGLKGDAIISWFRPTTLTKAQANSTGDVYYMVVNGYTQATGDASQTEQYINLDFSSPPSTTIQYIDPTTGTLQTLSETNDTVPATAPGGTYMLTPVGSKMRLSLFLDGGDSFLFKLDTDGSFAGYAAATPEPASLSLLGLCGFGLLSRRSRRRRAMQ